MYYSVLHCVAGCCSTLQRVAVCCNILHCGAIVKTNTILAVFIGATMWPIPFTTHLKYFFSRKGVDNRVRGARDWRYDFSAFHATQHCSALQHTATHCNTLHHSATQIVATPYGFPLLMCDTVQHTPTQCNTVQHSATQWNTVQHSATHCNTLQHTATHCNSLQLTATLPNTVTHCNTNRCHYHSPSFSHPSHLCTLLSRGRGSRIYGSVCVLVHLYVRMCMCVYVYVCMCFYVCMRACMRARVRVCVCVSVCVYMYVPRLLHTHRFFCSPTHCNTLQHTAKHLNLL